MRATAKTRDRPSGCSAATAIVGVLPVNPRRLHVYWDVPRHIRGGIVLRCSNGLTRRVARAGSLYISGLRPDRVYSAEICAGNRIVARSEKVATPPGEPAPRGSVSSR